jgi:hypothetical protein
LPVNVGPWINEAIDGCWEAAVLLLTIVLPFPELLCCCVAVLVCCSIYVLLCCVAEPLCCCAAQFYATFGAVFIIAGSLGCMNAALLVLL